VGRRGIGGEDGSGRVRGTKRKTKMKRGIEEEKEKEDVCKFPFLTSSFFFHPSSLITHHSSSFLFSISFSFSSHFLFLSSSYVLSSYSSFVTLDFT
jgi:hypothetical protein